MLKITTTPDQIIDYYTVATITDEHGDEIDTIHLDASDHLDTWDALADLAIAAAGYRRTGPWTRDGAKITAPLTPAA